LSGFKAESASLGEYNPSEESINLGDRQAGLTDELEPIEATVNSNNIIKVDDTASDMIDTEPRHSSRMRILPERFRVYITTKGIDIPKSYKVVISNLYHRAEWERAIQEELGKLQALDT
jgi:hypothetical protein